MKYKENKEPSSELVKLKRERQRYYNKVNKELTFIREWMLPILEERADKYSNPLLFAKYLFKKEGIYRLNQTLDKIYSTKDCFNERYGILREIYRGRFGHFDEESLFEKHKEMIKRREDLKKRIENVEEIKANASILKKKRAKNIIKDVKEELERRERAIKDIVVEFKRRGIDLEQHYTLNLERRV